MITEILDVSIGIIKNLIFDKSFNVKSTFNIIIIAIFVLLIIIYIILRAITSNMTVKSDSSQIHKACKQNGVYDSIANEMIDCVKKHDYKNVKELIKIAKYIEK